MAYEKQTQKILAGSWNLLPPGDLIPPEDCLRLKNYRVDSVGSLVSRLGHSAGSLPSFGAAVRKLYRVDGLSPRHYAVTAGGDLYQFGSGTPLTTLSLPCGLVTWNGYLYAMSQNARARHSGSNLYEWTPTAPTGAPTLAADTGTRSAGAYTYYYTWGTDTGEESNLSQLASITITDDQLVTVSGFGSYTPASGYSNPVTKIHIYRIGGAQEALNRIATISTGTSSYDDDMSDADAANGLVHNADHDPPPYCSVLAGPYYGRLLAACSATHPNRVWWSAQLGSHFPGAALVTGNHADVGEDGERIIAITLWPRMATIWKESSIWRMVGDPDDLEAGLEQVAGGIGLVGDAAIVRVGNLEYFQAADGIYAFNGDTAKKVSHKLDPLFLSELPDHHESIDSVSTDYTKRELACMAHRKGRVYFSHPSGAATANNRTFVLDTQTLKWAEDSRAITAFVDQGQSGDLLGAIGGQIYTLELLGADGGAAIPTIYETGFHDQGAPDTTKTYADVVVEIHTGGVDVTVSVLYDNGAVEEGTNWVLNNSARGQIVLPLGTDLLGAKGRNIAVRLTGSAGASPIRVYAIHVHYHLEARPAKTWDTDETDCGTPLVKAIRSVELDLDSTAAAQLKIWAALPGASMAAAKTVSIPATNGRKTLTVPVEPEVVGRLLRFTLTSDTPFLRYGARVEMRPVGVYVDGANSESWDSRELSIGI